VSSSPEVERERFALLSIFFPMWNEEAYIHRAVRAAQEICERLVTDDEIGDYEIIVVDDASTDATGRLAEELAAADRHVRVVHHPRNRKLGGSIKSGFDAAKGDLVLYTDADLPFEMIEIVRAVRVLRTYEADVVSAYRFDRTAEGPRRAVYSWAYNGLIHVMFGIRMRDINFAFKLCRRCVLDHITLSSEGSFIDAELIIRAQRSGFEVVQIGVDYFPRTRGISTLSSLAVIRTMVREMMALREDLRSLTPVRPA
jgi:glycosyltransferase involved in cell wall biosynthesis